MSEVGEERELGAVDRVSIPGSIHSSPVRK